MFQKVMNILQITDTLQLTASGKENVPT